MPCYDADFDPYGGEHAYTNTCPQNYKFEGKERDTETGNDDFGARYYSNRYGRWLSADWSAVPVPVPYANLTNPQTLNLYSMVSDDPESFADLDGHCDANDWCGNLLSSTIVGIAKGISNGLQTTVGQIPAVGESLGTTDIAGNQRPLAQPSNTTEAVSMVTAQAATTVVVVTAAAGPAAGAGEEAGEAGASEKSYQTYIKTNPETGEVYSGRTSGTGTSQENVSSRDANHHMSEKGFGPARLDKSSTNKDAIRGREQQLIEQNGGAKSQGGTSGNAINGVAPNNPNAQKYKNAAIKEFPNQ